MYDFSDDFTWGTEKILFMFMRSTPTFLKCIEEK